MSNRRFTDDFKEDLYKWLKQARGNNGRHGKDHEEALRKENLRLKNELKRVEEERDILKKAAAYLAKASE
jgi:transposase